MSRESPAICPELELSSVVVLGVDRSSDELGVRSPASAPLELDKDLLGVFWNDILTDCLLDNVSSEAV